jgi:hypothetical protein
MSTIFISHSSEDNAWAERIRDWLQGNTNKQQPDHGFRVSVQAGWGSSWPASPLTAP